MRKVVQRVDAPGVRGTMVVCMTDPVGQRVTQIDVARRHIDPEAQHQAAVGEFTSFHAPE